jgi:thiamine-monophosphate kinase
VSNPQSVQDVDESRLIDLLNRHYPQPNARLIAAGIGDDAAILEPAAGHPLVTVDTLVQGKDFLHVWPSGYRTSGVDVGWKSAAQNLSDINAMGGVSTAGFVTLSLPPDTPLTWVDDYARGVALAAQELGAPEFGIAGGDLSSSTELQIGMTVIGHAENPVRRSGARPGDRLLLAGSTAGMAHVGLSLLLGTERSAEKTWSKVDEAVAGAQLRPRPPLGLGPRAANGLTSLMDVSDGLVRDASRLAVASGVGVDLDPEALEREAAALRAWAGRGLLDDRNADAALHAVLYGGEDFGLLGTSPGGQPIPEGFRQIGVVAAGSGVVLDGQPLRAHAGFDHFDHSDAEVH